MKTLYSKFLILTLLIMVTSTLIGFLFSNTYYHQKVKPENDQKNTEIALNMAEYAESQNSLKEYLEHTASTGYQLYVINQSGYEEFYGGDFRDRQLSDSIKQQVLAGDIYHGMENFPNETFVTGFFANELGNTIGVPFEYDSENYALFMRPDIELLFSEIHIMLGWMVIVMLILSVIAVLISAKFLIKPIKQLSNATGKVADEGFDVEIDINRNDEIGELGTRFNHMIKRLGELDHMRKSFISNVSHDIQSPLLNIKGYARLLEDESLTKEERTAHINIIREETDRLSKLARQLLVLTSLDQKNSFIKTEPVPVSQQLKEIVQKYRWMLEDKDLSLNYKLPEAHVSGDASMLYAAWENLFTNAVKYTPPGGRIDITLEEKQNEVTILFKDTGIGMTEEDQLHIFERFYRADQARTRATEGTGLGLSIVKQVIELHNGEIQVSSAPGKGTTFSLTLKKM
ncbi:sensor histidine kinase [Thalassobacillus hwangdonensis]|uniref:Heme sensor protein HssS n=1 Tax=Thalassobacillus hwangdonensis TaxID=546108 RepID=A0ABW3L2E2_9BACI